VALEGHFSYVVSIIGYLKRNFLVRAIKMYEPGKRKIENSS